MDGDHRRRVGEWIEVRLGQLEMTAGELAERVGVRPATVYNSTSGKTKITPSDRGRWEAALGWKSGSLTRAYRQGAEPEVVLDLSTTDDTLLVEGDREALDKLRRLDDRGRAIIMAALNAALKDAGEEGI